MNESRGGKNATRDGFRSVGDRREVDMTVEVGSRAVRGVSVLDVNGTR